MNKADKYFLETLEEINTFGQWDKNPRPKWLDGTQSYSKFITQKTFDYNILKVEFPITSLRPTAIRCAWFDIEAIYINQTNIISEMHPSIQPWWKPFKVKNNCIGQTYGHTVRRYDLMNKLLNGMIGNPFSRRHIINLWQEQQMIEDNKALVPCAYETLYTLSKSNGEMYVDMTLNQRSQDYIMTSSINPIQYVMFGMAICGHLTYKTGIEHKLNNFKYNVQNIHIYDRHMFAIDELRERECSEKSFSMKLKENKNFYLYTFSDFIIENPYEPTVLSKKLEIAI